MDQIDASDYLYYPRHLKLAATAVLYIYHPLFLAKNDHFLISYDKLYHLPALQSWPDADFGPNWPFLRNFFWGLHELTVDQIDASHYVYYTRPLKLTV